MLVDFASRSKPGPGGLLAFYNLRYTLDKLPNVSFCAPKFRRGGAFAQREARPLKSSLEQS